MKKKLFTILIMTMLSSSVIAVPSDELLGDVPDIMSLNQKTSEQVVVDNLSDNLYKEPVNKTSILKKFLLAMGGVGISSVLLLLILFIYKKLRLKLAQYDLDSIENMDNSLEEPYNMQDALKIFLDKTNWEN